MSRKHWLNATVFGIGVASLFSDLSHEVATSVLPQFLGSLGAAAAALGSVEGAADGLSCVAKLYGGWLADRVRSRKTVCAAGYGVMALAPFIIAAAATWPIVLIGRCVAWISRGVRSPSKKALMADAIEPEFRGRAFGFERMMDTCGAIAAPLLALALLGSGFKPVHVIFLSFVPAALAALFIMVLVREKPREKIEPRPFLNSFSGFGNDFYQFLAAVGLYGCGDFAKSFYILYASTTLAHRMTPAEAATRAVAFYALYNAAYAVWAYVGGWLIDHFNKRIMLAIGYACVAGAAGCMLAGAESYAALAAMFALGGAGIGIHESAEDTLAAELLPAERRGSGYGALAVVAGTGDLVSSALVGWLWALDGPELAFSAAAGLMTAGVLLVLHLAMKRPSK